MHPSFVLSLFVYLSLAQGLNTNLTLPWGTWQAQPIYTFQNVRFGSEPIRFGNPSYPNPIPDPSIIQDPSYGPSCIQVNITALRNPPGGQPGKGSPITIPPPPVTNQSEDCLFLDIYAPATALRSNARKLPVVVWFYGGAYAFGSKLQFSPELYSGQGLIEASNGGMIFVVGNYRLGAYGWLAGSYMEQNGLPNAGLYDQRLILQWVQDYIDQVGGDKTAVSAWGESAGAGSIMHHLVQADGQQDPLFSKAVLQSPAFQWQWDRNGTMNDIYRSFSNLTGCGYEYNISCLRSANDNTLINANQKLFANVLQTGLFPLGPSVDGKWINKLAAVQFKQGKYWDGLQSVVISHVANESGIFTPKHVVDDATFNRFVESFMDGSGLDPVRRTIQQHYDCTKAPYNNDYKMCVGTLIRDAAFTCNTRQLYDAYKGKAYMMQYSFPAPLSALAVHASDLLPTFISSDTDVTALLRRLVKTLKEPSLSIAAGVLRTLSFRYRKYLASHAVWGDPNKDRVSVTPKWPLAIDNGNQVERVLEVRFGDSVLHPIFGTIKDSMNTNASCGVWNDIANSLDGTLQDDEASIPLLVVQKPEL